MAKESLMLILLKEQKLSYWLVIWHREKLLEQGLAQKQEIESIFPSRSIS